MTVCAPPSLRYASDELRDDMDIALIAVKSNGLALDQAGRVQGLWPSLDEGKWFNFLYITCIIGTSTVSTLLITVK